MLPFNQAELIFMACYLLTLPIIGWLGYRARRENSMRDFYLAGPGIGFVVLLLTLYATQYSGTTLFGSSGRAYRVGFAWLVSVHYMTAIVVCYLFLAPKLFALARREQFLTPADYIEHRFNSPAFTLLSALVMTAALANYLLAQLMAMGRALEGLMPVHADEAYFYGVIVLAVVIVIYETLGGFRAVAWTDVLQGTILLIGFLVLLFLVFEKYGSIGNAVSRLLEQPGGEAKLRPPDARGVREWLSYVFIVGVGAALYPQAIQRIYAARSGRALRLSLAVMAFLPLSTAVIAVIVGVVGAAFHPGLQGADADRILSIICREIQQESPLGRWLVALLFAGILAAIMSTADSVLLSVSSMFTKDIYARHLHPDASEARLTAVGKISSWALIALLAGLAILLKNTTLIQLIDRKFDLLIQLAPAFFVGLHWPGLRGRPAFWGMLAGVGLSITLAACGFTKPWGVHPGIYGLALNLAIAVGGSLRPKSGLDPAQEAAIVPPP